MIQQDDIERILAAADIKEVIGDFVPLKKRGTNYVACCPFHSEKTPSFTVFPRYHVYKCFGCGKRGDVVGFLMEHEKMTYPEALRWLAKRYGIQIKERVPTPQEETEYKQREMMWAANEYLAKVYAEQLHLSEHQAALNYVLNRWGKELCDRMGIGYCPPNAKIVDASYVSEEIADALHLRNKGGYDFFNGRITIPIRDRARHIVGFTSRVLDDSKPKYMNSSESLVYSKSKSIFGIDVAWREAGKEDKLFLVEGAPDCMRLQSLGIYNTVATLGTAWTEEHFMMLKRAASHLCFLPDADPPRLNERYGPGVKAVMKSGIEAIKKGFSVSVKQIPVSAEKLDPDSYCTDMNAFNLIEEKDFILWLAELKFADALTTEQQSRVVSELADVMAYIEDETTIEMYISKLVKFSSNKRIWQKALDKQRKAHTAAENQAKADKETGLLKKYGFNEENNKYYSINEKGYYEWSNFTMQPLFHIKDSIMPKRIYILRNIYGVEELVELKQEDLVSLSKFKQKVEGLGNFIWMASEKELTKLKLYLGLSTTSLRNFTDLMFQVFGDNGRVGFCFFLATLFRDEVTRETRSFPILNLFGPKGSGKTELGHTLMSLFVSENVAPNIQNSTISALNDTVAAVANALVHIDEFKNDIDVNKREFLKGLWDGTGRTRMNMDLDKKKETTAVDSGVILSGQEMATADIALFSRLIFLSFSKSEFTQAEKDAYQRLKKMRQPGMTHLTLQLLGLRNKVEASFRNIYQLTLNDISEKLKDSAIEDRILLNWVGPLAMLRTLESDIDISLSYKEMLSVTLEGIKRQNSECRQNNELASFWNMVQFLVSDGELVEGGDYRILHVNRFQSSMVKIDWYNTHPVLYLQKSRIFMLYKKHGRAVGDTLLPEGSLKYYLENSKAYLGEKNVRYDVYFKGVLQYDKDAKNKDGSMVKKSTTQRSFCFDYLELVRAFDINLERSGEGRVLPELAEPHIPFESQA